MRFLPLLLVPIVTAVACSPDDTSKPRMSTGAASSSSSASSSGNGGEGGGPGGMGGGGGQGGADAGVELPSEAAPADPPCTNNYAFWTLGMSFGAPTPQALAQALNELTYDFSTHPLSIILMAKDGVASAKLGVSATVDDGAGLQIFQQPQPVFVPALLAEGGFKSFNPQLKGLLRVNDTMGPVDIELENITVNATTSSACSNMVMILNADIPTSEHGKTLHLKGGDSTIGDLGLNGGGGAGGKGGGAQSFAIRAYSSGETMSFDFASLK